MSRVTTDGAAAGYPSTHPISAGSRSTAESYKKAFALSVAAFAVLFAFWRIEPVPVVAHLEGTFVVALSLYPLFLWYRHGMRGAPMFELVSLSFGAQYVLPLYLLPNQVVNGSGEIARFSWATTESTLALVGLGMLSLQAGYYGFRRSGIAVPLPQLLTDFDERQLRRYLFAAGLVGLATLAAATSGVAPSNSGPFGFFVRLIESQSTIAIALLAYRVFGRKRASFGWHLVLASWVIVSVVIGLASAALENAVLPLAIVLIVRWEASKRLPWKVLILGIAAFILFDSVKAEYRTQIRSQTNSSIVTRAGLWYGDAASALADTASGDVIAHTGDRIEVAAGRLDLLHIANLVEETTPGSVPYLGGRSYKYLEYAFVPRLLWPNKPATSGATDLLALRYGLLTPAQLGKTSVGLGEIAEADANFGILGIVVVLAIAGAIFAILSQSLNTSSSVGRAFFISIMIYYLNGIGTSTAVIFGGIVENVLPGILILLLFCRLPGESHSDVVSTDGSR